MMGHFVEHDFVGGAGVDAEVVIEKDMEEFGAGETPILPLCVQGFPFSHTFVAHEDDIRMIHSDDDALVAEFPEEAPVAVVNRTRYGTEVPDGIVERITVDVIDGVAFGDRSDESKVLEAGEKHVSVCTT